MPGIFRKHPEKRGTSPPPSIIMLADMEIDGKARKVLMQAPKNGYFYMIDRTNGQFISA